MVIPGKDVRKTHRSGDQPLETSRTGFVLLSVQNEIPSCVEQNLFVTYVLSFGVSVPRGRVSERAASFDIRTPREGTHRYALGRLFLPADAASKYPISHCSSLSPSRIPF